MEARAIAITNVLLFESFCSISYLAIIKPIPKNGKLNLMNSRPGSNRIAMDGIITESHTLVILLTIRYSRLHTNSV